MGRCTNLFSVNCVFITVVVLVLAIFIPLLMPAPNQAIINACKARDYKRVHALVQQQLAEIETDMRQRPAHWKGRKEAQVDDIDFGGGRGPLHIGAMYGDEAIVKYMHKRGADVNRQKDEDRRTPLHMAAMFGTSKIVELLIAKGATVDARAESGWTPLLKGVLLSNHDIVSSLLAAGADPNAAVDGSFNAMQCALIYSDPRMALLLLRAGGFVEPGESRYDDFVLQRQALIAAGLVAEEDIPAPNSFASRSSRLDEPTPSSSDADEEEEEQAEEE